MHQDFKKDSGIEVKDLFHWYHRNTPLEINSLKNINLTIKRGEIFGIVGKTGSGKSTLIQHFNGLILPQKGDVIVDGIRLSSADSKSIREVRKTVGLVFQYPEQQFFAETVFEEIAFAPRNMGYSENEVRVMVEDSLNKVGLSKDLLNKSPFSLSGGEKRKVAIASILSMSPSYIVFDEPTCGMDALGKRGIVSLIKELHKKGITVVIVSHDLDLLFCFADRIAVMVEGKVVSCDVPEKILFDIAKNLYPGLKLPVIAEVMLKIRERGFNIDIAWDAVTALKIINAFCGGGSF